nr:hypothetical protein [Tanacetum cinerariifolium]
MLVAELIQLVFSVLDFINTTNGHQLTMSNRQERIGNSRANDNCSKIVNSVKQIHAIVDGNVVVISESLVRSDLLFDDEDGITCLTNNEIFVNLALMGYEPLSTKLTFQKGNDTPHFDNMLVQNQAPEGEGSAIPPKPQSTPSIPQPPAAGTDTGGNPRCQETIGGTFSQPKSERVLEQPNEPPLTEGHTYESREVRLEVNIKLTYTVPTTHDTPLTGGDQAKEIDWNDPQVLRYHALQNRPFSKADVKKNMIMYLKNQGGYKQSYFKGMKKRAGFDQQQGSSKKQSHTSSHQAPVIIEYKIVKEGKINTYHITRADGSTRRYTSIINLLENIDKEDLETFWKLVKDKYGSTRPEEGYERVLWGYLKVMFKPDIESEGFTAALTVLITGASQSRKHNKSESNGNGPISVITDTDEMIKVLPLKIAEEVVAKERERKAKATLLMALPEDHLAKFHKMDDAKEMFQTLPSQLGINGAGVSHEDKNQKFLRSLPSSRSQMALIMRTKLGLDTLSFDDIYNNLRVFECDVKGTTTSSSSNTQDVAFVSDHNTNSINDINDDDIEEMDLKWQVAMISIRINKFYKRTGTKLQFDTKDPVGFDKTKVECFNCHKMGHFARDCKAKGNQDSRRKYVGYNGNKAKDNGRRPSYRDDSKALVTIDREDIDWFGHVEKDAQNYAMMAYSSNNSGFDNEESDLEHTSINDRYAKGMHVVPPPMTGNYMPSRPDVEIDYSKFTYGLKQTLVDESDSRPSEYASCESNSSVETTTSMPEPVESAPKVVCEPKVWIDAVSNVQEDKEKPSFAFTDYDDPHRAFKDKGIVASECSRHMTGNKAYLADYQEFKGGSIAFGELKHYNLFSVSQMCDKKNKVLFSDTDCLVLSPDFKLPDEHQVLLEIPR